MNLTLFQELEKLLRMHSQYCTEDGVLLKNAIVEAALDLRPDLIKLLMSHDGLRHNFFTEVDGVMVFDKVRFQKFVTNKRFLPDSYTSFKNKIGLMTEDGDFIAESREVVLSWPFKDCILEGGQTREDAKRDEVLWNEILAPDEINRLTEPKVLTDFRRYDLLGQHEVDNISMDDNLIIKGNNLLALHSLRKKYAGRVKLIYIDPPYNTGNDSFLYNDRFNHSTWLTFMKNRLEVAKELLSPNGSIFIQLDWNEVHYCKILMDSVFGRNCFRNEIIWCYTGPGSPGMKQLNRKHDNILWYSNNPEQWIFNGNDVRMESEVHVGGFNGEMTSNVSNDYSNKGKIPEDWWEIFHTSDDLADEIKKLLEEKGNINDADWFKAAVASRIKVDGVKRTGYSTEKPYKLMERIIKMASKDNDIVLDFFAGSGTTGFVANYLNRKFIMVEQLDDTISLMLNRLKVNGSFVYCELARANQDFIDEIIAATTKEQLHNIWQRMQQTGFLSWKVEPKDIDNKASDIADLSVDDTKRFLHESIDNNMLYVPYSEIDNAEFGISEKDKQLNRQFYSTNK